MSLIGFNHLIQRNAKNKVVNDFKILKKIDEGAFGIVVKAKDNLRNELRAIKFLKSKNKAMSLRELKILEELKLVNPDRKLPFVYLYSCFELRKHLCLVMECLDVSVAQFMKKDPEFPLAQFQLKQIFNKILRAGHYLRGSKIVHTDIKPTNICFLDASSYQAVENGVMVRILVNTDIKLVDFGNARSLKQDPGAIATTRAYRAPEVILQIECEPPMDAWAIGCTIFEITTGKVLFPNHFSAEHLASMELVLGLLPHFMSNTFYGKLFWKEWKNMDTNTKDRVRNSFAPIYTYIRDEFLCNLLKHLLQYDPKQRYTPMMAMCHPYFDDLDLDKKVL